VLKQINNRQTIDHLKVLPSGVSFKTCQTVLWLSDYWSVDNRIKTSAANFTRAVYVIFISKMKAKKKLGR